MTAVAAAILDYGAGNLVSVAAGLEAAGASVRIARQPADLVGAGLVVVPGVGASGPAMARLRRRGLDRALGEAIADGAWYLGICLGLQLLFERSEEDGAEMLGSWRADVRAIPDAPRLPHIGWNTIEVVRPTPARRGRDAGRRPTSFTPTPACRATRASSWPRPSTAAASPSVVASGRLVGDAVPPRALGRPACASWRLPSPGRRPQRSAACRADRAAATGHPGREGVSMLLRRVIPCLDVADGRVVKGTRFVDLRDAGDPAELAAPLRCGRRRRDRVPRHHRRPGGRGDAARRSSTARPRASSCRSRSVAACAARTRCGPSCVPAPTRCRSTRPPIADPTLIRRSAGVFGRQCVVVAIDAAAPARHGRGRAAGRWEVVARGGREPTGLDAVGWARRAAELGRRRDPLTSIDRDGTRSGFDLELLRAVTPAVDVPVIASGGAGSPGRHGRRHHRGRRRRGPGGLDLPPRPALHRRPSSEPWRPPGIARPAGAPDERSHPSATQLRAAVVQDATRRARPDGRLGRRRSARRDATDRPRPLPLALARPPLAEGRDERQHAAVRSIEADCDGDAYLVRADPTGPTCHTGARSCFDAGSDLRDAAVAPPPRWDPSPRRVRPHPGLSRASTGSRRSGRPSRADAAADPASSYTARLLEGGVDAARTQGRRGGDRGAHGGQGRRGAAIGRAGPPTATQLPVADATRARSPRRRPTSSTTCWCCSRSVASSRAAAARRPPAQVGRRVGGGPPASGRSLDGAVA